MAPVLWGVQESQDGSWERLSLQRIHCGTGELCSGRGLRNATEDSLIRVSSSALGQRLRSAPADFDPRRRFASVHSASDSTSPSRRIAAAELFTDAQTRHWAPLQSIRLGWRWTLWMRQEQTQYPSFAGARQVAGVAAGQGGLAGLFVAMPPPPWLAWWRSASWVRHTLRTAAPRRPTATTTGAPTERAAVRARTATMASGTITA